MKALIVNADDFGASSGVNRAVVEAHLEGVVCSASLMVGTRWLREAVADSRDLQDLSLGIHVVLTDDDGLPSGDWDDSSWARSAVRAQMELFWDTVGRQPSHIDSHRNVHRDPRLRPHFLAIAEELGGVPVRENSHVRYFPDFYGQWDGETHPEQISVASLKRMLTEDLSDGITELSCHPGYRDPEHHSSYSVEREMELRTLCDPSLPAFIEDVGYELVSYLDYPALVERLAAGDAGPA